MALLSHAGGPNARVPGWAALVAFDGAFTHTRKTVSIEKKNTAASLTATILTYNIGRLFCLTLLCAAVRVLIFTWR